MLRHGLNNVVTLEGGVAASRDYAALAGGIALNTAYGALSADLVQTFAGSVRGQRLRLAYQRLFPGIGTSVSVSGDHQMGGNYLSLADAVMLRHVPAGREAPSPRPVRRLQALVNQPLGDRFGALYVSAAVQAQRHRGGLGTQFQLGYTHAFGRLRYSLAASRDFSVDTGRWNHRIMLTLGMPLGQGATTASAAAALTYDPRGRTIAQQSLTGSIGDAPTLTYGLTANATRASRTADGNDPGEAYGASANATYFGTMATVNGNAGAASGYRQAGGGVSGVIVGYAGGVAASPAQGDTLAVVEADDIPGARIASASGTRIGPWGRAVVSNLQPFARNAIEIDPRGLPLSVELGEDTRHVAPTQGAVVRARFETHRMGRAALIRARMADGQPLPFGAEVFAADGRRIGTVAQGGRALVRGLPEDARTLTVTWGADPHQQCALDVALTGGTSDLAVGEGRCAAPL
ncbi:fimbrial biogenesis outer membrane usher protein [Cupriavidus pauculus]|uniref:Fimbrial biogenesis outer membrane usher protein n=2 Tax=Cupriavidus pauculus TaxID=82633 RepID=A0A5P2H027_9BURK|nr:fimbrial biogenesis outer membrane usher protein [Cupriavidus pauculus]